MTTAEMRDLYAAKFRDDHHFTLPWEPTADEAFAAALGVTCSAITAARPDAAA